MRFKVSIVEWLGRFCRSRPPFEYCRDYEQRTISSGVCCFRLRSNGRRAQGQSVTTPFGTHCFFSVSAPIKSNSNRFGTVWRKTNKISTIPKALYFCISRHAWMYWTNTFMCMPSRSFHPMESASTFTWRFVKTLKKRGAEAVEVDKTRQLQQGHKIRWQIKNFKALNFKLFALGGHHHIEHYHWKTFCWLHYYLHHF